MKLVISLALILICNTTFGQCANGRCAKQRRSFSIPVQPAEPTVTVVKTQPITPVVVHSVSTPPSALVQRVVVTPPSALVQAITPRRTVVVQRQPVLWSVPKVYNTPSFRSNGSGIDLETHVRVKHGINTYGMTIEQIEAEHSRAHGYR